MNFMREIGWLKKPPILLYCNYFIVEICKTCISLSINVIHMLNSAPRMEKHQVPIIYWETEDAGQQLGTWGLSGLEKRRLRGLLYIFLKGGSGEGGADLIFLGSSDSMCRKSPKLLHQERLGCTLGNFSLPSG